MKKYLALILALAMVFALAACGQSAQPAATEAPAASEEPVAEAEEAAPAEESAAEEPAAEEAAEEAPAEVALMSYAEFAAAAIDDPVCVETYVQAKQSWWDNKATVYTQDQDGAYFLYNMGCSEEDYAKLVPGQKIRITGYKADFQGEIEIADATFELLEGNYIAPAVDITEYLGTDELINFQNRFVSFTGMTVAASQDADGNDVAFLYKWNGSGQEGDDLYFNVEINGNTYTFTVESYLRDQNTEVYQAVKNLNIGDKIDMTGYAYWYDTLNPHIISVTVAE